jgi:muconate cycloisomerase
MLMLTIDAIEITPVQIPFRASFKHALAAHEHSDSLIVRAAGAGMEGYGECVPRAYVTGETVAGALATIDERLAPAWRGARFHRFEDVVSAVRASLPGLARDEHAAFCALELAVLDLAGRFFDRPAGEIAGPLGGAPARYSGVVSASAPDEALSLCAACRSMALSSVKLKVGQSLETDLAVVAGARHILGPGCSLRVDANCAWTLDEALERIELFRRHRVEALEQPLAAGDIDGLRTLTAVCSDTLIVVDESLVCRADAEALIEARACDMFNVRISKNGGLVAAVELRDLAIANGLGWMLGAQVGETAILSAAGRQLVTRVPRPRWAEGSFGTILLCDDLGVEDVAFAQHGGAAPLPGPGLGVDIDPDRVATWRTSAAPAGLASRASGGSS